MRKKTKHTLDASDVKDAWQKLFDEHKTYDEAELSKQGWLSIHEISDRFNMSISGTKDKMRRINAEKKMFTIHRGGGIRLVSFYRVK
jgi:hypothetical protein